MIGNPNESKNVKDCAANATTACSVDNKNPNGVGDYLSRIVAKVNTTGATATLQIKDSSGGSAITLHPGTGFATAGTYNIELGIESKLGQWQVVCGSGLSAVAIGQF